MSNHILKRLENTEKQINLEPENLNTNSLKKQYFDLEHWKFKVKMVSDMKNKEVQKMNLKIIELKNLQDKVYKKRIENCDFVHNLIKNSWMANLGNNFRCETQNTETEKNKINNLFILKKLEEELNEIKSILEALNFKRQQEKKLIEYIREIDNIEHSITIWNEEILKIELEVLKSEND